MGVMLFLYIARRVWYRAVEFLRHWYVASFHAYFSHVFGAMRRIDYTLAFRVTARYFWQPLYRDYSPVGRILGVFFRSVRLAAAGAAYALIFGVAVLGYAAWLLLPPYLLAQILIHSV